MSDIIREIEAAQLKENVEQFEVGDTVKVYGKIKEGNRERIQVFEGCLREASFFSAFSPFNSESICLDHTSTVPLNPWWSRQRFPLPRRRGAREDRGSQER